MSTDVVLLRTRDPSSEATLALADAIAARYGVPAPALADRLKAGSFNVKSGTDLETAKRYARDLEELGAVCELRDSATGRVLVEQHPEAPAGLAAASGSFSQGLGALEAGNLALSTLDGRTGDTRPPPIAQSDALAEPYNLATPPAGVPSLPAADPTDPTDAFAPPKSEAVEEELMLAIDTRVPAPTHDVAPVSRTMAPEPMPLTDEMIAVGSGPQVSSSAPSGPKLGDRISAFVSDARRNLARRTRGAFVAGVIASLLVGFAVSHIVAVFQETDSYASVRKDLAASYEAATDPDSHAALSSLRKGAVDLIESRQRKVAVTGLVVWLLAAAGMAAIWFRVVPWERLEHSVS